MKIITLNTWGGRIREPLVEFIKKYKDQVDIFCFQEIYNDTLNKTQGIFEGIDPNLFNDIKILLPSHVGYFCPVVDGYYGMAIFVKERITVKSSGDFLIYENLNHDGKSGDHSRMAQWFEVELKNQKLLVLNIHGLWNGKGKTDTQDRIKQSRIIKNFIKSKNISSVLCGDFNLLPETESLSILSEAMRDLIKEYNVTSTRTSFYTRAETSGKFADYILVSENIKVLDFKVLSEEVSDHSALFVNVNLS